MKEKRDLVVIKLGGALLDNVRWQEKLISDLVSIHRSGFDLVVVHGSGPSISQRLNLRGQEPIFIQGLRVTNYETLLLVEEELKRQSQQLVWEMIKTMVPAVSILGNKNHVLVAEKLPKVDGFDLGLVGRVVEVNVKFLLKLVKDHVVPVIAPLGANSTSEMLNVNADQAAAAISSHLQADLFIMLTESTGVIGKTRNPISELSHSQVETLIEDGTITSGMIPKVKAGIESLEGAKRVIIADGRENGILRSLVLGEKVGTELVRRS